MIVEPAALADAAEPTLAAGLAGVVGHRPDAVIVSAFGDPGVPELRAAVPVPVLGIGEAALRAAADRRVPYAVVTSTPLLHAPLLRLVESHCPGSDFVGIFYTDGDPVELGADPPRNVAALHAAVDVAIAAGARAAVIGGGPLTGAARQLAARTDVAVIEPVRCAVESAFSVLNRTLRC
jgi:Asp/Glu/hydantoin racemase